MDIKGIRLECLKLALDAARRAADIDTDRLLLRAAEYERFIKSGMGAGGKPDRVVKWPKVGT